MAFATIDVTKGISGTIPVANGGTGLASGTTGQFLKFTGTTTLASASSGGITEADQWRITSDLGVDQSEYIVNNWERNDSNFDKLGTGMSESSGIFTFPSTGIWQITANASWRANGSDETYLGIIIQLSTNSGGAYVDNSRNFTFLNNGMSGANEHSAAITQTMIDVTDASTFRLRFEAQASDGFCSLLGNSGTSESTFTFIRLGDT